MDFTKNLDAAMYNLSKAGAFLTVKSGDAVNTMTVSWGFIGYIWNKPHFITVVRPQRYTNGLIEKADSFTISIPFDGALKEELTICGTRSGSELDKGTIVDFVPAKAVDSPVVAGCQAYYECKIDCVGKLDENLPEAIVKAFYNNDFHNYYIGEIVECY